MSGLEWIVEAHGCKPGVLSDLHALEALFDALIGELHLHPLGNTNWHQFPNTGGITGVSLLFGIASGLSHISRVWIAVSEYFLLPVASRPRILKRCSRRISARRSLRA